MISMLTISIFIYIVYVLANRILAVQIHIKYLILCGCCAFFINSIFPRIFVGFAGLSGTLGIVTIFILLSSYFIASYYDNTLKKATFKSTLATASVTLPERVQAPEHLQVEPNIYLEERVEVTDVPKCLTAFAAKQYYYPVKYEEHVQQAAFLETNNINFFTDSMSKNYLYPVLLNISNVNQQSKPKVSPIIILESDRKAEVFNTLMNFNKQKNMLAASLLSGKNIDRNATDLETKGLHSDLFLEDTNSEAMNEVSFSSLSDLDSLMDFAFSQKEQRDFPQALKAFRQALRLYPDSEVAPFLAMEIGTILKNLGSYNGAITVFIEGRELIGVINNSTLDQEFINNIAYLRIVKNALVQNSLRFMPFNLIPESAMKEINKEFSEWRNQSCI